MRHAKPVRLEPPLPGAKVSIYIVGFHSETSFEAILDFCRGNPCGYPVYWRLSVFWAGTRPAPTSIDFPELTFLCRDVNLDLQVGAAEIPIYQS